MTVRQKTGLVLSLSFVALTGALLLLAALVLWRQYRHNERQQATENLQRVYFQMDEDLAGLHSFAEDYATWDDTCQFVADGQSRYVELNLQDSTFTRFRLSFLVICDLQGKPVYGQGFDLAGGRRVPLPAAVSEALAARWQTLVSHRATDHFIQGILPLPGAAALVVSAPVIASDGSGPVRGSLVAGRYLDRTQADTISRRVQAPVTFLPADTVELPPAVRSALVASPRLRPAHQVAKSRELLVSYGLLRDLDQRPALVVRTEFPRLLHRQFQVALGVFAAGFLCVGLVVGYAGLALMDRLLLRRLHRLHVDVAEIRANGRLDVRTPVVGRDEISALAGEVNGMLDQLATDLRQRQAAEQELRENRELLRLVLDQIPHAVYAVDHEGRFLLVNQAFVTFSGRSAEALVGKDHRAWCGDAAEAEKYLRREQALMAAGTPEHVMEEPYLDKAGLPRWWHVARVPFVTGGRPALLVVAMDISEVRRIQRDRDALTRELARQNEEMTAFLRAVTHDLSSPVANIAGFADILARHLETLTALAERADLPADVREAARALAGSKMAPALSFIQSSAKRLQGMVEGLSELARCGRVQMHMQKLDMRQLLRSVQDAGAYQLQQAEGVVETVNLPPVFGDAKLVSQLFANLLENAVKYRSIVRPLRVRIDGELAGSETIYTIEDNGMGIPAERIARIWELFYRANPDENRGQGIGLALVRRIVERHRGRCDVTSVLGQGTRFTVTFDRGDTV